MQSRPLCLVDNWYIGTIEPVAKCTIREYNPEWVSIDIRGRNVRIYRGAFHWCLPKDSATGACYNSQTGDCYSCARENCQPPYEWLGVGTSCPDSVQPGPSLTLVYRLWSPTRSVHFYAISESEKQFLLDNYAHVWAYDGVVFYVYPQGRQPPDSRPVYRFWSAALGHHFYTISEAEKALLIDTWSHVWAYEGIAWYAYPP